MKWFRRLSNATVVDDDDDDSPQLISLSPLPHAQHPHFTYTSTSSTSGASETHNAETNAANSDTEQLIEHLKTAAAARDVALGHLAALITKSQTASQSPSAAVCDAVDGKHILKLCTNRGVGCEIQYHNTHYAVVAAD